VEKYLRLAASVGLLGLLAKLTDWPRLAEQFARVDWRLWALTVGIYLVAQVLSALRWQLLARPLGFPGTLGRFTAVYFIGMYFNLFLPTSVGGDVLRAWYVDQGSGRKVDALLSVFVDRLNGFLVLLGIACVAACFSPGVLVGLWGCQVSLAWVAWPLGAAAVLGLAGVVFYLLGGFPRAGAGELAKEQADAEPVGGDPDQGRAGQPAAAA
jgi:uncharacterized protein (TIRG00374 family)